MPNNPYLQNLYRLETIEGSENTHSIAAGVDTILMKLEDGEGVTDEDWGRILLHVAALRRMLGEIEENVLRARSEPSLTWRYEEEEQAD